MSYSHICTMNPCPLCYLGLPNSETASLIARIAELERLNEAYRERLSPAISCPIEEFLGPVKPCPFCGSEGINLYEDQVECGNCRATAEPGPWQFRDTRKLETAESRIRELEDELERHQQAADDSQQFFSERQKDAYLRGAEAALRWAWNNPLTVDCRPIEEVIQRGLKAVCGGEK